MLTFEQLKPMTTSFCAVTGVVMQTIGGLLLATQLPFEAVIHKDGDDNQMLVEDSKVPC